MAHPDRHPSVAELAATPATLSLVRLRKRLGGWRMVERYDGDGVLRESSLPDQPVHYQLDVWEQFLNGQGGRYKVEGSLKLETLPETQTIATVVLEKEIRLRVRIFPGGRVLGDSGPEFPD